MESFYTLKVLFESLNLNCCRATKSLWKTTGPGGPLPSIVAFNDHSNGVGLENDSVNDRCWRIRQRKGVDEGFFRHLEKKHKAVVPTSNLSNSTWAERGRAPLACCRSPVALSGSAGCGWWCAARGSLPRSDHLDGSTDRCLRTERKVAAWVRTITQDHFFSWISQ